MIQFVLYNYNFIWGAVSALVITLILGIFFIDAFAHMTPFVQFAVGIVILALIYGVLCLVGGIA